MTLVKRNLKFLLLIGFLIGVCTLLVWAFIEGRKEFLAEQDRERPVKALSRLAEDAGETVIILDDEARSKGGITVVALEPSMHSRQVRAYGTVLSLQGMMDLYNAYIVAQAQVEKARLSLDVSSQEYDRVKSLHNDDRNMSDKVLQAAAAAKHADEAGYRAAQSSLGALQKSMLQQWGEPLANLLITDSAELHRLFGQQELLLQITLPAGVAMISPPKIAFVQAASGPLVSVRYFSGWPRTDSRLQGKSWLYSTSAVTSGLLPGMNVVAYLPVGESIHGITVPDSAVVRWQGAAWFYREKGEGHFVRRILTTDWPVEDGWFVTQGFDSYGRIVTAGAQLLLSEELRAQIQVGEEGGKQ